MARYRRLTLMEREELSRMLAAGYSLRATGQVLGRAPSTLSRELSRHHVSPLTYRAVRAHERARRWAHHPRKPRKLAVQLRLRTAVLTRLAQRWSPEQIARGLRQRYPETPTMRISHEAIYTYLYVLPRGALKRELIGYLRQRHRFRRPHKPRLKPRPIQDFISIDERPAEVAGRTVPGHWEGDLLVGHANASALGTLVRGRRRLSCWWPLGPRMPPPCGGPSRGNCARSPPNCAARSRMIRVPKCASTASSPSRRRFASTLRTGIARGSGAPMKTPMGCSANSSPRARTSIGSRGKQSNTCRRCSTTAPGKS